MHPAITTVALIVGDLAALKADAIRLLFELRYFVENRNDPDPIIVVVDGPEWRQLLPDDLLIAPWLTVIVLDTASDLPAALINRALVEIKTEWVSFCWPGTEVSTWYANKNDLLEAGIARHANIVAGYRGAGESRLQAVGSTESILVHPDDGFSSDYPRAWLQMLDLVPMANAIVRTAFIRDLGGFTVNPLLQRHFWWVFTLRASAAVAGQDDKDGEGRKGRKGRKGGKIDSLPLQPIPVQSWHRYQFSTVATASELTANTDRAVRIMMGASSILGAERSAPSDLLWNSLPHPLRNKLTALRALNNGKGLRITVLGGVNEPAHNQLCFFNFFELVNDWGVLTWRSMLDEITHPADLTQSDLVIFSRVKSANGAALMDFCVAQKIPTIYMLDDNWFWLGREWPEYEPLFTPGKPTFDHFMHCLKNAETVLTYNQHLAADLAPYAQQLKILPTNVDLACFPRRVRSPADAITVGYVGSIRKNAQPFQALVEIAHARPDVRLFVMSNTLPDELSALPKDRVTFRPYQFNYAAYAATVCAAAPDVLIAPVGHTRFEASKCPNKYLEITACGAVGVYSHAPPYTDYVRENDNGVFADDDIANWRSQIERLIDDHALRSEIAQRALKNVQAQFDTRAVLPAFLDMLIDAAKH